MIDFTQVACTWGKEASLAFESGIKWLWGINNVNMYRSNTLFAMR